MSGTSAVSALHHALVLCDDIERSRKFYEGALGLRTGQRPPLEFDGFWLYAGQTACLHVADRSSYRIHAQMLGLTVTEQAGGPGPVDHLAFVASDYDAVCERLERCGVRPIRNDVPGGGPRQLFFSDPDGARIEINVPADDRVAAAVRGLTMQAAVTERVGSMSLVDRPDPGEPGAREVLVAPEAVGICGSDYHFFSGELSDAAGGSQFPRVQGHEVGATIVALGSDCRSELEVGQRVALLPIHACGHCYPCRVGRPNACDDFQLIGIHLDGGLQERLAIGQDQVFPIRAQDAATAAMVEPVSIAVRAVRRGRIEAGERVVVLGAGPIGQCACLVARELGAEVLMVDLQPGRLELAAALGADTVPWTDADQVVAAAREWAGEGGPAVGIDATGVPAAVRAMVDMVASAGRAVQVGMSTHEVSLRIGSLTEKEIDLLGVCCCTAYDFAEAVGVVERNPAAVARLVSHEFALAQAPEAISFAMSNPTEVMKVVIRDE